MLRSFCSAFRPHLSWPWRPTIYGRLLRTVEALSELGPELTAERDFTETSRRMLAAVMEAAGAGEGAPFRFQREAHDADLGGGKRLRNAA